MARLYALQLADQRAMEKQGVRENPIRRGGYSGGAAPTQPVRFELASERAEEIQANRTNPRRKGATPTMGVSQVRGGSDVGDIMMGFVDPFGFRKMGRGGGDATSGGRSYTISGALKDALHKKGGAMSGGRAVPSSGLSQFRGGAMERMVGAGHGSDSDSDEECEGMGKYEGMGKLTIIHGGDRGAEVLAREKASRPAIRSGLSAQHSAEAKQMGQHLGSHLLSVKGGGFFELFTKGIVEAGQKGESVAEQTGMPNANAPPPPTGIMTTTTPPTEEQMGGEPTKGSGLPSSALYSFTHKRGAGSDKPPEQIELDKMLKKEGAGIFDQYGPIRTKEYTMEDAERNRIKNEEWQRTKPRKGNEPYYHDNRARPAVMGPYHDYRADTMEIKNPFMKKKLNGGKTILDYVGNYVGKHVRNPKSMFHAVAKGVVNNAVPLVDILTKDLKGTGYLSGQYEGMGEDYSEQRRQGLAKRKAANAAVASRKTPAQKAAEAKQQAELRAVMEKQHDSTDAEKKANFRKSGGGARATRAAIVKKVMAEKGCSMIEASKYVKEHGLYKGGMSGSGAFGDAFYDINSAILNPLGAAMKLFGSGYEEAMKLPKKRHVNKRYRKPFEKRNEDEEGYDASKDMGKDAVRRAVAEHKKNQAEEYAEKKKQGYAAMAEEAAKKKVGGKQRRAPAGPSDGRRKRAEIVKRVMAEKGCSMIEASKHVKAHGLY